MKNVGAVIRAARVKRKLSLREVARLSRVSAATLSKLEAGAINPTLATMQALTTALGIKPAEWFE
jgi:transcriptional regulator with XRE-family HTH domain